MRRHRKIRKIRPAGVLFLCASPQAKRKRRHVQRRFCRDSHGAHIAGLQRTTTFKCCSVSIRQPDPAVTSTGAFARRWSAFSSAPISSSALRQIPSTPLPMRSIASPTLNSHHAYRSSFGGVFLMTSFWTSRSPGNSGTLASLISRCGECWRNRERGPPWFRQGTGSTRSPYGSSAHSSARMRRRNPAIREAFV